MAGLGGNPRPGRKCVICKDPVAKHHSAKGAVSEWVTLPDGRRKLRLWHERRCWPEELRQRRLAAREAHLPACPAALEPLTASLDDIVTSTLPPYQGRPQLPPNTLLVVERDRPREEVPTVQAEEPGSPDPPPEVPPIPEGTLVEKIGKPGKHRGLTQAVALVIESYSPGTLFTVDDVAKEITELGFTTTRETVTTLINKVKVTRGILVPRREGNKRTYERLGSDGLLVPELPEKAVTTTREEPVTRVPRQEPVTTTRPESNGHPDRALLLKLVDRTCADLQMMMAELIAATRQELRKEVERLT